jgi:hypothetical protein
LQSGLVTLAALWLDPRTDVKCIEADIAAPVLTPAL